MRNHNKFKIGVLIVTGTLIGLGTYALADWGPGYGRHMGGYGGMGMGYDGPEMMEMHRGGMGYGPGMGYGRGMGRGYRERAYGGFSDDDLQRLDKEREAFWKETEGLRNDVYQKELELRSELAKNDPDVDKARKVQEEILALRNQVAQKRLDHMIKIRKENPNVGRKFMGRGMGFGPGGFCGR